MLSFKLASKFIFREWQSGQLRVLLVAIIVAVGSLTTIQFYVNRIEQAIEIQANELIAADRLLTSSSPIDPLWKQQAEQLGLKTAILLVFPSVVNHGELLQLTNIKAVSSEYPLRGNLETTLNRLNEGQVDTEAPKPGEVWVEPRLLDLLDIDVGSTISIGYAEFMIAKIITYEPDRGASFFNIAPRVMMNIDDVEKTQIIQTASRVSYSLLLSGEEALLAQFSDWLEPKLLANQRLKSVSDSRSGLENWLTLANRFLGLASLLSVLLAGIAIAVASQHFAKRHFLSSVIMRCCGAVQKQIFFLYAFGMLLIGFIGSVLGSFLGYLLHFLIDWQIQSFLPAGLPSSSLKPFGVGVIAGLLILCAFALPPLLNLLKVSPMMVLRHQHVRPRSSSVFVYGLAMGLLFALLMWLINDWLLSVYIVLGSLLSAGLLYTIAKLMILLLKLFPKTVGIQWRYGFNSLLRRPSSNSLQVVSFGLVIMALLLLAMVRQDLLDTWSHQLPDDAPNYFLINIQPQEISALNTFLNNEGVSGYQLYPIIRGRMTELNGEPILATVAEYGRDHNALHRDLNLSWAAEIPFDNTIVEGVWWDEHDTKDLFISMELDLAKEIGVAIGDEIGFQIGGDHVVATVTSFRQFSWDTFQPNFFVLFSPGAIEHYPAQYMTSFYMPPDNEQTILQLIRQFPTLTLIDVDALLAQARVLLDKMSLVIQLVFLFSLIAGVILLLATIQATKGERLQEITLLRTLGASDRTIGIISLSEFLLLGLLAGVFGALAATILAWAMATFLFEITYQLNWLLWVVGIIVGIVLISTVGMLATQSARKIPPYQQLWKINT